MDERVARLARKQYGVVTRRQLRAQGFTSDAVHHLLTDGRFTRWADGIYVLNGMPESWEQSVWLVACAFPRGAVSHEAACAWLRLPTARRRGTPTVLLPIPASTKRKIPSQLIRTRNLDRGDVIVAEGLRTTTAHRSVVDTCLGWHRNPQRISSFLDACLSEERVTVGRLWEVFLRVAGRGRTGSTVLREQLLLRSHAYHPTQSELESMTLAVLKLGGLPPPVVQPAHPARPKWRVDFAYLELRMIIEVDGRQHRIPESRETDYERDAEATASGWAVLRFSWGQITNRPDWCVEKVRETLRTRSLAA